MYPPPLVNKSPLISAHSTDTAADKLTRKKLVFLTLLPQLEKRENEQNCNPTVDDIRKKFFFFANSGCTDQKANTFVYFDGSDDDDGTRALSKAYVRSYFQ